MGGSEDLSFAVLVASLLCEFLLFLGFYYTFSDFVIDKNYSFQYIVNLKNEHELSEKYGLKGMGIILISMHPLLPSLVSRILMDLDKRTFQNWRESPAIHFYGFLFFCLFMLSAAFSARGKQPQSFAILLLITIFYSAKQLDSFCKEHRLDGWKTIVSVVLVFLCLCFTHLWFNFKNFQCFDFIENDGNVTYYLFIYLIYLINHWDSPALAVFFGEMALVHSLMTVNPYATSLLILYYLVLDLCFNHENNLDYRYFFIRTLQEEHQKILFLGSDDKKYPRENTIREPAPGFWVSFALKIVPIFIIAWMGFGINTVNTSCGGIRNWLYLLFLLFWNYLLVFSLFAGILLFIGCCYCVLAFFSMIDVFLRFGRYCSTKL
jgi:hypothetical protein